MALNIVWVAFFVIAFLIAVVKCIMLQDASVFNTLATGLFDAAKNSVLEVAFPLTGTMIFFLGIMNIAEKSGVILVITKLLNPFMKRLFPDVPKEHPAMGEMVMNFSANMLGLDNAATPFGLKSMESLQSINPQKDTATNAQIMFAALHTSGLTLIPLSLISYRIAMGSTNPTSVFIPCVLGTIGTTIATVLIIGIKQKIKWDAILIGGLTLMGTAIAGFMYWINSLVQAQKDAVGSLIGNGFLLLLITLIVLTGVRKKLNVFDIFIEGAKNGFAIILKIMPYLVGMLVAIRVFRDSGALQYAVQALSYVMQAIGIDGKFTPALPVAIMRPFSASGARGMMLDVFKTSGVDSFAGQMASIFMGSADTTFYILALYFGSVGIKKLRYALWASLFADCMGILFAILVGYIFFI